jgi:hypothetical protein
MAHRGNLRKWYLTSDPAVQVVGSTAAEVTFIRRDFQNLPLKTLYIYNGGAGTLVNGVVEISPDNTHWGTLDGTTFANLGSNALALGQYDSPARYWKFTAAAASSNGSLSGWWTF